MQNNKWMAAAEHTYEVISLKVHPRINDSQICKVSENWVTSCFIKNMCFKVDLYVVIDLFIPWFYATESRVYENTLMN